MKMFVSFVVAVVLSAIALAQPATEATVIHFKKLQEFLPTAELEGFTEGKHTGTTTSAMGYSVSEASLQFNKPGVDTIPEVSISVKIIDMSAMQYMAMASVAAVDFEQETETGYEKSVKVKSWRGIERVNHESKSCELTVFSANRFVIAMESSNSDDLKPLYKLFDGIDLGKLEKLATEKQ